MKSAAARSYKQGARAAAAEATGERILDVFTAALRDSWFDAITLDEVAREAGVTVQTVIRRFGGKDGLLQASRERFEIAIRQRRVVPVGDADKAVAAVIEDYEVSGDLIMRVLAQEDRYEPLRAVTDEGRAGHRAWLSDTFAPWLSRLEPAAQTAAHDGLVVATDIYVWKLVRRDMGRSKPALAAIMRRMIATALSLPETEIFNKHTTEKRHGTR